MNAIEAMCEVFGYLETGDFACAQCAVMAIEQEHSVLPSSVFEKVLRAAIAADELLPQYAEWCRNAYGRRAYAEIVAQIAA